MSIFCLTYVAIMVALAVGGLFCFLRSLWWVSRGGALPGDGLLLGTVTILAALILSGIGPRILGVTP